MALTRTGGCDCGEIRYEFTSEILSCYACHCTDCQTRSGAAFALSTIVPSDGIAVTKGEPNDYIWKAGTVKMCPTCGVHLWSLAEVIPDFALVRTGTLDDTTWVNPVAHIWTRSAQPWIVFNEGAKTFNVQPENPMELLELWEQHQAQ